MPVDIPHFLSELEDHLNGQLIPYWEERAVDSQDGGFRTNFDAEGNPLPCPEKYLNTQCRMVWWFSVLANRYPRRKNYAHIARAGVDFLIASFWDRENGGWYWKSRADGSPLDNAKIVYGQSFAIYALAQFGRSTGDPRGLDYAVRTFDLLQHLAADRAHGGYFENLTETWARFADDSGGVYRKGLDTHMHLMESFTELYAASGAEAHRQKLLELMELIRVKMVNMDCGCGRNQFDEAWRPLPAIAIARTWNAERSGPGAAQADTTSYGHNVELSWLFHRAIDTAEADPAAYLPVTRGLVDHAFKFGIDREYGGIFRDGYPEGPAVVLEKEFWQHAECLVGFIDAFQRFGDQKYLEAAENLWRFIRNYMVAPAGEWRTLVSRDGQNPIDGNLGNPWKVAYHTGRALTESVDRLRSLPPAASNADGAAGEIATRAGNATDDAGRSC